LVNSKDVLFTACRTLTPAAIFLQVEGASSENIRVDGSDTSKAVKSLVVERGANKKAVNMGT
jgi:hypothetical protein